MTVRKGFQTIEFAEVAFLKYLMCEKNAKNGLLANNASFT